MRVVPQSDSLRKPASTTHVNNRSWVSMMTCVYLVLSTASSIWYVVQLQPSFANDLWWVNYTASGHQALVVDLFNGMLATQASGSIDILAPRMIMDKTYDGESQPTTEIWPSYARRLVLLDLTTVEYAVDNLRTMSAYWSVFMSTQFCWVDLDRAFELAHTDARQQRCHARYRANGAVYLETVLRNQKWDAFMQMYGGDGGDFTVAIQSWLIQVPHGRAWLTATARARDTTSVAQESAYWYDHGIDHFQLQWQNSIRSGISETMQLENALALAYQVELKKMPVVYESWTSVVMNWNVVNDWYAMQGANRSLIRSANNSYLLDSSMEGFLGLEDSSGRCAAQVALFRTTVGPFLAVDMMYVAVPPPLLNVYNAYQEALHATLTSAPSLQKTLDAIATTTFQPTPPTWSDPNWLFYGGNPMCVFGGPLPYVQDSFGFADTCTSHAPLRVTVDKYAAVFAFLGATGNHSVGTSCSLQSTQLDECDLFWTAVTSATSALFPTVSFPPTPASMAVRSLHVGMMQFAAYDDGSNWTLLHQPLLTNDVAWSMLGWVCLYDWVQGKREVVSFEGDVTTLVLISSADESPVPFASDSSRMSSATRLLYILVVYTTCVLGSLAFLCLWGAVLWLGRSNTNLVWFNRIVGCIWVGRPLLLLRGLTAMLVLSTTQLTIVMPVPGHSRFGFVPRSWVISMVFAGEATWVLYVIEDVLTIVCHRFTKVYGPLSCLVAWATLVLMDVMWPVQPATSLIRHCTAHNMDNAVQCASGVLHIGSLGRLYGVLLVLGLASVVFAVMGRLVTFRRRIPQVEGPATRHLLGVADIYLDNSPNHAPLDKVSCLMAGLVPLPAMGFQPSMWFFDVKLWAVHSVATTCHVRPQPSDHVAEKDDDGASWTWFVVVLSTMGVLYAIGSILGSLSYLRVSEVNLANDLFWATFNATGVHAFIASWLNSQLILGVRHRRSVALDTDAAINQDGPFSASPATLSHPSNFGGLLTYSEVSKDLDKIVRGLRATHGCAAPWIFTQFCFVDWTRRWELANSATRQARCLAKTTNGAVFVESILRNVRFDEFYACWEPAFELAMANDLRQSTAGQLWLSTTTQEAKVAVRDEVALWQVHAIDTFETQWQNFKVIGLVNHYSISNAFGTAYSFVLQNQSARFRLSKQTTFQLYWGLANDFTTLLQNASDGQSLIRSSAQYAFRNTTMESRLIQNGTLRSPLPNAFTIMRDVVGPYGSVDTRFVPCPVEAKDAIRNVLAILRRVLAQNDTQTIYANIQDPEASTAAVPTTWTDLSFLSLGGSPLCPEVQAGQPIVQGMLRLLSWGKQCSSLSMEAPLIATIESMLISIVMANMSLATADDIAQTCAQSPPYVNVCLSYLSQAVDFVKTFVTPHLLGITTTNATRAIRLLHVELVQFGQLSATSPLELYRASLLDPTDVGFTYFAWNFICDWAIGLREAVALDGDNGTVTLLTDLLDSVQLEVNIADAPTMLALYLRNTVAYITAAMIALASVLLGYVGLCRGHVEVRNLFQLQRVGASVWCGRPLLLVRSLTAVALLSTSTLQLVFSGTISYFVVTQDPWYKTLLAANEVTWMVAIVNDVAVAFTQDYTRHYAFVNTILVWLVVVSLSVGLPVRHELTIETHCDVVEMDFQLACESANLDIGYASRLVVILAVVLVCNLVCYLVARTFLHHPFRTQVDSIFVYAGARYLFATSAWVSNDVYYMDRMSAAMNGILTVQWGDNIHGLDVKLWRVLHVELTSRMDRPPASHTLATKARFALPLRINQMQSRPIHALS
ncbi:Aste57867_18701 [Aphanomyces stellatus]|uniref:Aste57867_18701 protein n=1 Tax=Aphanomyces stellatus TaxID=120398 RepID=A0A485LCH0_9STRA|nr:hypothetical protein As57867_018638 [Aphanomyces stellatus]VFT95436.1 Aste57867_18701 [Aphanomyces stellatus]